MRCRSLLIVLATGAALCSLLSCGGDSLAGGSSETGNSGLGKIRVETFDDPPPAEVEKIYLKFHTMLAHHVDDGWLIVCGTPRRAVNLRSNWTGRARRVK